jgi:hypothetical protein
MIWMKVRYEAAVIGTKTSNALDGLGSTVAEEVDLRAEDELGLHWKGVNPVPGRIDEGV